MDGHDRSGVAHRAARMSAGFSDHMECAQARLRTHCGIQKMMGVAMQMADMKVWAHRS